MVLLFYDIDFIILCPLAAAQWLIPKLLILEAYFLIADVFQITMLPCNLKVSTLFSVKNPFLVFLE